jgi:hypothetical protein
MVHVKNECIYIHTTYYSECTYMATSDELQYTVSGSMPLKPAWSILALYCFLDLVLSV